MIPRGPNESDEHYELKCYLASILGHIPSVCEGVIADMKVDVKVGAGGDSHHPVWNGEVFEVVAFHDDKWVERTKSLLRRGYSVRWIIHHKSHLRDSVESALASQYNGNLNLGTYDGSNVHLGDRIWFDSWDYQVKECNSEVTPEGLRGGDWCVKKTADGMCPVGEFRIQTKIYDIFATDADDPELWIRQGDEFERLPRENFKSAKKSGDVFRTGAAVMGPQGGDGVLPCPVSIQHSPAPRWTCSTFLVKLARNNLLSCSKCGYRVDDADVTESKSRHYSRGQVRCGRCGNTNIQIAPDAESKTLDWNGECSYCGCILASIGPFEQREKSSTLSTFRESRKLSSEIT